MRWLVLLVVAGCIEPNLIPCGDLSCPAGSMCLLDRHTCAFPDALAACDGQPDGTLCQAHGIDGACDRGLCVASVCGDGVTSGREQCDETIDTRTCADFRFYYGALACTSSCLIDTSGCSGSCGDGLVQSDHGEICDNTPPPRGCYQLGHDFGHVTCTAQCLDSSATDCVDFVPLPLLEPDSGGSFEDTISDAWKDLDLLVVARQSGLVVIDHGIRTNIPGTFQRIAAHAGTIVVGHMGEIDRIDHGALIPEPDLGANGATVLAQDFTPTGELWAITSDCQVRELVAGVWQTQPSFPDTSCLQIAIDGDGDVYAASAADVRWFDGAQWVKTGPSTIHTLNSGAGGRLLAVTASDTFELHRTTALKTEVKGYWFDAVAVGDGYLAVGLLATRFWNNQQVYFDSITDDPLLVRRFGDGSIGLWDHTLYALEPVMVSNADPTSYLGVRAGTTHEFVAWTTQELVARGVASTDVGSPIHDIAITGETIYALTDAGVKTGGYAGPFTTDPTMTGYAIWADAAGDLAVVQSSDVFVKPATGTWTALPHHGCANPLQVAGPSLSELYAIRNCSDGSAELEVYDGANWKTAQTLGTTTDQVYFDSIAMLPDGTIAVGGMRVVIGRGTTWTVVTRAASQPAGTSATDLWFGESPTSPTTMPQMAHWNGVELVLVRQPMSSTPTAIAVSDHSVFLAAAGEQRTLVRWPVP